MVRHIGRAGSLTPGHQKAAYQEIDEDGSGSVTLGWGSQSGSFGVRGGGGGACFHMIWARSRDSEVSFEVYAVSQHQVIGLCFWVRSIVSDRM